MEIDSERVLFLKNSWVLRTILVLGILILGFAIRLVDLSDPPLDFAATRQLRSLIIARGIYYDTHVPAVKALPEEQVDFGIQAGAAESVIEPTILEHLAAYSYVVLGFEDFRIPRLYSIFFWVIGGIPLYLLSHKLIKENGAIAALAFYEFVPFGILSSRAFQPDPLMVCLILWALYFQYRWSENGTLANALIACVLTGLAIFVKTTAVFFVGVPFAVLVLNSGLRKALRNPRVYWMAALCLLPGILFIAWSAIEGGNAGAIFGSRFFPSLYIQPHWYQSWFMTAKSVVGYFPLFLSILALFLFSEKKNRVFYASLLFAYLLLGIFFAYHIYTHDYYSVPLIPIAAIGFGLIFSLLIERIESLKPAVLAKIVLLGIFAFASALSLLKARTDLLSADYRYEEVYWKNLGDKIGHTSKVVALTHDYGYRLSYWGFIRPRLWDTWGDINVATLSGTQQEPFLQAFTEKTGGYNYFLVTLLNDFNSQTDLHDYLYAHYPYEEGEGYILFDLQHPS